MSLTKRKKIVLSMEKKLTALRRIDNGEPLKNIAREYGVGTSTVSDWKRNRNEIEAFCAKMVSQDCLLNRGTTKKAKNEALDDVLFFWYTQEFANGTPITGPLLQEKALEFNGQLNGDPGFAASSGWLDRWKGRHGVQLAGARDGAGSWVGNGWNNNSEQFSEEFLRIIEDENLKDDQIYYAYYTGLYCKVLPTTLMDVSEGNTSKCIKQSKERIALMISYNASGKHKLPLMVISKTSMKNVNAVCLPVVYKTHNTAWVTVELFKEWFLQDFVSHVKEYLLNEGLPLKAVLFVDHFPSDLMEDELIVDQIKVKYLRPKKADVVQPMGQGLVHLLKCNYRKQLINKLLERKELAKDDNKHLMAMIKSVSIKDVIYMSAMAWDQIKKIVVLDSWKTLRPNTDRDELKREFLSEDEDDNAGVGFFMEAFKNLEVNINVNEDDVSQWLNREGAVEQQTLASDELVVAPCSPVFVKPEVNSDEELSGSNDVNLLTHSEAVCSLDSLLTYLEEQSDTSPAELMTLKKLRDRSFKKYSTLIRRSMPKLF